MRSIIDLCNGVLIPEMPAKPDRAACVLQLLMHRIKPTKPPNQAGFMYSLKCDGAQPGQTGWLLMPVLFVTQRRPFHCSRKERRKNSGSVFSFQEPR